MKTCTGCGSSKPTSDFNRMSRAKDGLYPRCKACLHQAYLRRKARLGKEGLRRHHLRLRYGLTPEAVEARREAQGGRCGICNRPGKLFVDHNHADKTFRGLLCHHCNSGLGMFGDNLAVLEAAIRYLEQNGTYADRLRLVPS